MEYPSPNNVRGNGSKNAAWGSGAGKVELEIASLLILRSILTEANASTIELAKDKRAILFLIFTIKTY